MRWRNSAQDFGALARFGALDDRAIRVRRLAARHVQERLSARRGARRRALRPYVAWPGRSAPAGRSGSSGARSIPPPPAIVTPRFEPWLGLAAKAGHFLLYLLLIATPALGIVLQFSRGLPLPLFGLSAIPSPWAFDRELLGRLVTDAPDRRQCARRRRHRPRRSGADPSLDPARPHARAHGAGDRAVGAPARRRKIRPKRPALSWSPAWRAGR